MRGSKGTKEVKVEEQSTNGLFWVFLMSGQDWMNGVVGGDEEERSLDAPVEPGSAIVY